MYACTTVGRYNSLIINNGCNNAKNSKKKREKKQAAFLFTFHVYDWQNALHPNAPQSSICRRVGAPGGPS